MKKSKRKVHSNAGIAYRYHHMIVKRDHDQETGSVYFTVVNTRTQHHSHVDTLALARIIAQRAVQLYIPDRYGDFLKEAIRRVI